MNLQHLKYVVEVEKTGSISQAAEILFMNQPNLSKAVKELEASLGITIFRRSSKGVFPTPEGAEFLSYARGILSQIEEMEARYPGERGDKHVLRLSIPRSSYVAYAFTALIASLDRNKGLDVTISEVGTLQAVRNILEKNYHLGIIRYQTVYESYFLRFLMSRNLCWREIWEFDSLVLMSCDHPLARCEELDCEKLEEYIEIGHDDLSIPNLPIRGPRGRRRICARERGSQLDLLARTPETYMWVSPMPEDLLKRNGLVQRFCAAQGMRQKDVLIYPKGHVFGALENRFLLKLEETREEVAKRIL